MSEGRRFRPRRSYQGMALLGVGVALLFGWETARAFAWPTLFFLIVALGVALVNLRWAASPVYADDNGLTCHRPPARPLHINYRQIAACEESGRGRNVISLIYFPAGRNGMLDLDAPRSCFLPGLEDQEDLMALIQRRLVE